MNTYVPEDFIDLKSLRDENLERIDVLDRIGALALMPNTELSVLTQVADFYKVPRQAISSLVNDHREELVAAGMHNLTGYELANSCKDKAIVLRKKGCMIIADVNVAYTSNLVLPKRAILLVGMLLRDSEVSKQVRTYLLDVHQIAEEVAPGVIDIAVGIMQDERELKADLAEAILNGDVISATSLLGRIKNQEADVASRRITELTEENLALLADNNNLMAQFEVCAEEKMTLDSKLHFMCQKSAKVAERRQLCLSIIEAYGLSQFGSEEKGYNAVYYTLVNDYNVKLIERKTANPKKKMIDLLNYQEFILLEMLLRKLVVTFDLKEFYQD